MSHVALLVRTPQLRPTSVLTRTDTFERETVGFGELGTPSDGGSDWTGSGLSVFKSGYASAGWTSVFADSFARADGAVGNGWDVTSGYTISDGKVVSASGISQMTQSVPVTGGAPSSFSLLETLHLQNTGTSTTRITFPTSDYCVIAADGTVSFFLQNGTANGVHHLTGSLATGVDLTFIYASSGVLLFEGLLPVASALLANHAGSGQMNTLTSPYIFTVESSDVGQTISAFEVRSANLSTSSRIDVPTGAPATAVQIDYALNYYGGLTLFIGDVSQTAEHGGSASGIEVFIQHAFDSSIWPTWVSDSIDLGTLPQSGTIRAAIERGNFNVYINGTIISSIGNCPFLSFDGVGIDFDAAYSYGFTPDTAYVTNFRLDGFDTLFNDTFEDAF